MKIHFNLFNCIIHRNLRPWLLSEGQQQRLTTLHKSKLKHFAGRPHKFLKTFKNVFEEDLNMVDLNDIDYVLNNSEDVDQPIHPKTIYFPLCYDDISDFYHDLIKYLNEGLLFVIVNFDCIKYSEDEIKSHINTLIRLLQVLIDDINAEQRHDELTIYVFNLLRLSLFNLFSQILYFYGDYIDYSSSTENKFLKKIAPDYFSNKENDEVYESIIKKFKKTVKKVDPKAKPEPVKKLSFKYKYPDSEKLESITRQLQLSIDFLKVETDEEDFIQVMTADDLSKMDKRIFLDIETTQFRYIIDKLKPFFHQLTFANIEKSEAFYSKRGTLITASNLSRSNNPYPKEKEKIDSIFKEMQ